MDFPSRGNFRSAARARLRFHAARLPRARAAPAAAARRQSACRLTVLMNVTAAMLPKSTCRDDTDRAGTLASRSRSVQRMRMNVGGYPMSVVGWIVLGLIAGFIASKIVNKKGEGIFLDIVLGIVGAVVGGFVFAQFGAAGVTGFNLYSMLVAVVGAIIVLVLYHAITG